MRRPGRPRSRGVGEPGPRRWTQLGTVGVVAHVFYELVAGVGMPLASRVGPAAAATLFAAGGTAAFREAGRRPSSCDPAFSLLNGFYLSAVIAHFAGWPRSRKAGLPWLTECEGLRGAPIQPYNLILYASAAAAIAALLTENRRGRMAGALAPTVLVPWLIAGQHREFTRLRAQAEQHPRWWNRRLAG